MHMKTKIIEIRDTTAINAKISKIKTIVQRGERSNDAAISLNILFNKLIIIPLSNINNIMKAEIKTTIIDRILRTDVEINLEFIICFSLTGRVKVKYPSSENKCL